MARIERDDGFTNEFMGMHSSARSYSPYQLAEWTAVGCAGFFIAGMVYRATCDYLKERGGIRQMTKEDVFDGLENRKDSDREVNEQTSSHGGPTC